MKHSAKKLALIGLFLALLIISSVITKIPMYPMPMTLQTAVILCSAMLIGGAETFAVVVIYSFTGLLGIPVFTGGGAGLGYAFSPTFGFIIGFAFGGLAAGVIAGKKSDASWSRLIVAAIVGTAIFYIFGITYYLGLCVFYFGTEIEFGKILLNFWILFVPSDILKGAAAVFLAKKTRPVIAKTGIRA